MNHREEEMLNQLLYEALYIAERLEREAFDIRQMTWKFGSSYERRKVVPPGFLTDSLARDVIHSLGWGWANLDMSRLIQREIELLISRDQKEDNG